MKYSYFNYKQDRELAVAQTLSGSIDHAHTI